MRPDGSRVTLIPVASVCFFLGWQATNDTLRRTSSAVTFIAQR